MKKDGPSKPHLIASKVLPETNNSTITKAVLDSFRKKTIQNRDLK
jgi:hypothetical protein